MENYIHIIKNEKEIDNLEAFKVVHSLWTSKQNPATEAKIAFIPSKGFVIKMRCFEKNPLATFKNHMDMVCKDSAMEFFFCLPHFPKDDKDSFKPYDDCLYMNFEMNSFGALYSKYGFGRKGRIQLTDEERASCKPYAEVFDDFWEMNLLIPLTLIKKIYGIDGFEKGDRIWCNFYKISESSYIEHYMAFAPIDNPTPNFHLPRFFAPFIIE